MGLQCSDRQHANACTILRQLVSSCQNWTPWKKPISCKDIAVQVRLCIARSMFALLGLNTFSSDTCCSAHTTAQQLQDSCCVVNMSLPTVSWGSHVFDSTLHCASAIAQQLQVSYHIASVVLHNKSCPPEVCSKVYSNNKHAAVIVVVVVTGAGVSCCLSASAHIQACRYYAWLCCLQQQRVAPSAGQQQTLLSTCQHSFANAPDISNMPGTS